MAVLGGQLEGHSWWHRESRQASWRQCLEGVLARTEQVWGVIVAVQASRSITCIPPSRQGERTSAPCRVEGSAGAHLPAPASQTRGWQRGPDIWSAARCRQLQLREGKDAVPASRIPVGGLFSYREVAPIHNSFKLFWVPIRLLILLFPPAAGGCVRFVCNQS